jgi:hypothetical protein
VVHRDLKPSNLLITRTDDGEELLKVVDFGLVKLTEVDVTITSAGLILGSPHCMAPEQVRGQEVDARTDIYALGILLFRCLTGTYPFHGANSTATMIAHLNQATPTFFSVNPDLEVPEGLEQVVRRCLYKNPAERFQRMEDAHEALAGFMAAPPDTYRTVARTATLERSAVLPRRYTGLWLALAGLVGTLLLVTLAVLGVFAGLRLVGRDAGTETAPAGIVLQPGAGLNEAPPVGPPPGPVTPDTTPPVAVEGRPVESGSTEGQAAENVVKPEPARRRTPQRAKDKQPAAKTPDEAQPAPDKVKVGSDFADDFDEF